MTMPVVAIVGPTAVGKSAVADALAAHAGSAVLSVDAMQVYRGMNIGTAKMPPEERHAPLLLVDLVDPEVTYSAALFQRDARAAIDELLAQGRMPVLCGGTGLYLKAALDDMHFPAGQVEASSRAKYEDFYQQHGMDALHALLAERDPASAAVIHPHNVRRVVRALEMLDEGVSYAEQRSGFGSPQAVYDARIYALTMDRERLYARINERVDIMMRDGLLNEVQGLMDRGAGPALTARQAIGYKELIDYLEGRSTLDEAIELIKMRSRRYAKRQLSWFRRDSRITWIDMDEHSVDEAVALIECEVHAS